MKVWRLVRAERAKDAYSGLGSEKASGRWHSRPRRVAYASSTPELAILEVLVQVRHVEALAGRVLVAATVPDDAIAAPKTMPQGWDLVPHKPETRAMGDAWLDGGSSWALRVPSALSPGFNVLLNPSHARHGQLVVEAPLSLSPALTGLRT